jgi:hypothetical protein
MLQTYTPAAELSDFGDFVTEFREQKTSPSTKHAVALFRVPRRAQFALIQRVETKEDFNQFKNFRDSE